MIINTFISTTHNQNLISETTGEPEIEEESADVSLIVGIIVGSVLILIVAIIATILVINAVKKKKSANISGENDPINSGAKGGK